MQASLPTIDLETNMLTTQRTAPGGHGQLGSMALQDALTVELPEVDMLFVNSQLRNQEIPPFTFKPLEAFDAPIDNVYVRPLTVGFSDVYIVGEDLERFTGALGVVTSYLRTTSPDMLPSLAAKSATSETAQELDQLISYSADKTLADIKIAAFEPDAQRPIAGLLLATRSLPYDIVTVMPENIRHKDSAFVRELLSAEGYIQKPSGLYVRHNLNAHMFENIFG